MSKNKFSFEKHAEVGATLKKVRKALIKIHLDVSTAYGKNSQAAKKAGQTMEKLEDLKCILDDLLDAEVPSSDLSVYYGDIEEGADRG